MYIYDDGGRRAAGFKGSTGDCVVRAIAIATGSPYLFVYDSLREFIKENERLTSRRPRHSNVRTGVYRETARAYIDQQFGWKWKPTMFIGSGCTVHVKADELPDGPLILALSKHYAAFVDGILRDTQDNSRNGTRCVYGYWTPR